MLALEHYVLWLIDKLILYQLRSSSISSFDFSIHFIAGYNNILSSSKPILYGVWIFAEKQDCIV